MKAAAVVCRNGSIFYKVCFVLCLVQVQSTLSQLDCESMPQFVVIATNTTVSSITMECIVPPELVLSELGPDTWEWDKLAAGIQMFNQPLPLMSNVSTTELSNTSYLLSVSCSQSGFYQAIYRGQDGSCVYRCSFFVEVEEIRESALRNVFSVYRKVNLSSPLPLLFSNTSSIQSSTNGSEVLVGMCSSRFSTGLSGCILAVSEHWFKDEASLEPKGHPLYLVSEPGDVLKIISLSEETSGQYVCVTTLPLDLGNFVTVDVEIEVSEPETSTTPSTTMATTVNGATSPPANGVTLRTWEVGLIVANIIVVILLVGLVSVGMVCFVTRRRAGVRDYGKRKRSRKHKRKSKAVSKVRPRSMVEHIQMMEEETEAVDYVGIVEVPFNAILFEELIHKGTFKVVHHAVVTFPKKGMMSVPVAVKRLKDVKSELGTDELMGEAYTLRSVQDKAGFHPNFVSLVGMTTHGGPTCLLLEYVPNGRLDDFLTSLKDGPIPEWYVRHVRDTATVPYHKHVASDLMSTLIQVTEGMKFLTDEGFIHRDLSTRTVLIGDRLNVKIADPGMFHEGYYYVVTEREHVLQDMAPECLWEKRYSVWSDVWSFGILAYKVVTLESIPFPDATVNDLYDRMVGGERPQLLASFSNEMYFLLQRCWQFIAVERPTFTNILSDLRDMKEKSARHIIFKANKESGYISDTGQVYLHALPSYALDAPAKVTKAWRKSGTQQSLISSIDGTMYTRETAETVIDFNLSENEDNYKQYLQGEVSTWKQKESDSSSLENEIGLDTPEDTRTTRVWVESSGSKVYFHNLQAVSDKGSTSGVTKKKKKKRDNKRLPERSTAAKSGFTNPMTAVMPAEVEDSFEHGTLLEKNTNTNDSNIGVTSTDEQKARDDSISSNGADFITEDIRGKGVRNGDDMSNQSYSSRQLTDISLEQLATL